jgi:hypothetical protein
VLSTNQMFFSELVFATRAPLVVRVNEFLSSQPPRSGPSLRPTRAARSAGRCQTRRERHRGSGDARPADMGALGTCSRATPCPPSAATFSFLESAPATATNATNAERRRLTDRSSPLTREPRAR